MKVPFLDLRVLDDEERAELLAAVDRVMRHGRIVLGPEVNEFEAAVAARIGRRFAIGMNSGTDALIMAFRALDLGPGDEVIMPPLSFVATANTAALVGAQPVFADLGDDLNLDPASIEPLITPRTRAIVPVHWTGKVCDMDAILAVARKHGLKVVEDTSQAFDAHDSKGRKAGTMGDLGCFSMNCMKVLASLGEAGAVMTDDADMARKLEVLRYHGLINREVTERLSHNGRLDTIQAAMLLVRLARLDAALDRRIDNARYYTSRLAGVVKTPDVKPGERHVFYTYTIQAERRDELKEFLEANDIEVKVQHTHLMPQQPIYCNEVRGHFPNALRMHPTLLCLPISEKVSDEQRAWVADKILQFYGQG